MSVQVLDDVGSVFFQGQLDHIKAKTYDIKYPELMYRSLFPVNTDTPAGAKTITYHTYDQRGMAKVINNYAKDLPRVDVDGVETTVPVRTLGDAFGYTVKEIKSAQMAGMPLEQRRSNAARKAIEELMNDIAFNGDAASGLLGLFSDPNVPSGNAPTGTWSGATAAQILADINDAFNQVFLDTLGVERATKLLLPLAQWSLIMTTKSSDYSDKTIAQYVVDNSPFLASVNDIVAVNELLGAGTAGVDVMVVMDPNPDKLQMEIPEDITFYPEQLHGLEYEIPVAAEFGGLNIYYPLSIYISEDI